MRSIEKSGKTIDEAIRAALEELKLEPNQVKVNILDEGSRGILGIGARPATVKVTEKEFVADSAADKPKTVKKEEKPVFKKAPKPAPVKEVPKPIQAETEPEEDNGEPADPAEAEKFLKDLFSHMGIEVDMDFKCKSDRILIDLKGPDMGIVIGKRGETLDAVQYLTSLVVNKGKEDYVKISVDTENYRAKREETLKRLANRLAHKALANKRKVTLEPMNAAERRIIHAELQNLEGVTTYSIGNDPARKVVIAPQK